MLHLEPNKTFFIHVHVPGSIQAIEEVCIGHNAEQVIEKATAQHPDFKRIVLYDGDTRDAVQIIKPNK